MNRRRLIAIAMVVVAGGLLSTGPVHAQASGANVTATKTVGGTFTPGSTVTYTIVLSNAGPGAQPDNPGDELVDVLPPALTLVSASATSGTPIATVATNTVTWHGVIPAAGSVTVTITATIGGGVAPGTVISNQAQVNYDADGNGTNESSRTTDDPAVEGANNPTSLTVASPYLLAVTFPAPAPANVAPFVAPAPPSHGGGSRSPRLALLAALAVVGAQVAVGWRLGARRRRADRAG